MDKIKVLFVCVHNSARSQMAEAFLKKIGKDKFQVESAGLEPGTLNPVVVESMKEAGIDISGNKTQGVFDIFKASKNFHYVITVCDETSAERCPIFPGIAQRIHWSFPDPSALNGSPEDKLTGTGKIRDSILKKIESWVSELINENII